MKNKLIRFGALLWALVVMAACSEDTKMKKLLDHVSEDMDVVVVGDVSTIIKSAGGSIEASTLNLSAFLTRNLPDSFVDNVDEVNSFLKESGIDVNACVWMKDYENNCPIYLFALSDKAMFVNSIEEQGFQEQSNKDGVVFYSKKIYASSDGSEGIFGYIAVKDSYAYWIERIWVGDSVDPIEILGRLISNAEVKPFGETSFGDYISQGNALGVSVRMLREVSKLPRVMSFLAESVFCLKGSLDGNILTVNTKYFGKNGDPMDASALGYCDFTTKINSRALSYMGSDESLIYAASLKKIDWDKAFEPVCQVAELSRSDMAMLPLVKSYLEKIDGTMAFGIGLTNGLESIFDLNLGNDIVSQLAITALVELKPDEADALLEIIKGLLDSGSISYEAESSEVAFEIPGERGKKLFIKVVDNILIASNHEIKTNNANATVNSINFSNYQSGAGIVLTRDHKLLRDLNLPNDIKFVMTGNAKTMEGTFTLEIDGGIQEGVIAKIMEIFFNMADQKQALHRRWVDHKKSVKEW